MSYGAYFRKLWSHEEIPKKFPGGRTGVIVGCLIIHFGGKVKSKFRKGIGMAIMGVTQSINYEPRKFSAVN